MITAGPVIDRSPAWSLRAPTASDRDVTVGYEIDLSRGKRDLLYWNRASNGFRKYGRNRDLRTSKLGKNDQTENLMAQIRKYYVQKEKRNPEKVKMIKNIIRSIEKSDNNLKISAQLSKNQK